jgi:hypothetical protein
MFPLVMSANQQNFGPIWFLVWSPECTGVAYASWWPVLWYSTDAINIASWGNQGFLARARSLCLAPIGRHSIRASVRSNCSVSNWLERAFLLAGYFCSTRGFQKNPTIPCSLRFLALCAWLRLDLDLHGISRSAILAIACVLGCWASIIIW